MTIDHQKYYYTFVKRTVNVSITFPPLKLIDFAANLGSPDTTPDQSILNFALGSVKATNMVGTPENNKSL